MLSSNQSPRKTAASKYSCQNASFVKHVEFAFLVSLQDSKNTLLESLTTYLYSIFHWQQKAAIFVFLVRYSKYCLNHSRSNGSQIRGLWIKWYRGTDFKVTTSFSFQFPRPFHLVHAGLDPRKKYYNNTNNLIFSTPSRSQREDYWIKKNLGTAFSYGCNDNINNIRKF
jgi:hypothetical protein